MATTRLMPLHTGRGRSFSTAISDIIEYVELESVKLKPA